MNLGPLTPTLSPKGERERSEFAARPDSITTGSALGAEPPTGGEVEKPRIVHGGTPACFARNKVPGTIRLGLGCSRYGWAAQKFAQDHRGTHQSPSEGILRLSPRGTSALARHAERAKRAG